LTPPLRLSFTPYISGYLEFDSEYGTEFLYTNGIDFKYGVSQGFTLDQPQTNSISLKVIYYFDI
jgi:hypothetical protein